MIHNACIRSTKLFDRERGLSFWIALDFDGWTQSAGGIKLGGDRFGAEWLAHICEVVGAATWEELVGMHCRVQIEQSEFGDVIVAIGNVLKPSWHQFAKGWDK